MRLLVTVLRAAARVWGKARLHLGRACLGSVGIFVLINFCGFRCILGIQQSNNYLLLKNLTNVGKQLFINTKQIN